MAERIRLSIYLNSREERSVRERGVRPEASYWIAGESCFYCCFYWPGGDGDGVGVGFMGSGLALLVEIV